MNSLALSLAISFLFSTTSVLAQSDMVPMPACLTTCFRNQARGSVSNFCTPNFIADVNACIPATCVPKDQTYVRAYFNSYCTADNKPNAAVSGSVTAPVIPSTSSLVTVIGTGTAASMPYPTAYPTTYPTAGASSGMGGAVANGNGTLVNSNPTPTAPVFEGAAATSGRAGWWFGTGVVGVAVLLTL